MVIARRYLEAQRSFVESVSGLDAAAWATPVACTPGWTVRDVLSHVAGVAIDVSEGNVEGAATDPWTASQVERFGRAPTDELIGRWNSLAEPVAAALEAFGERRPALDCHTHEHDVRHALGRPGKRESDLIAWMASLFEGSSVGRPVVCELPEGGALNIAGVGEPLVVRGRSRFDLVRSRLGRRSRAQVAAWDWSAPPSDAELDAWFAFGPSITDIDE